MRWIDNGEAHAVKVKLDGVLPKRLTDDWTVYFVINTNSTVQAKAIKFSDKAAYAELVKGLRPEGEYRFGFVNRTGGDIENVSVNEGAREISRPANGSGNIPVRIKFSYSDPLLPPIPSEVELQWKQDGAAHSAKVKLDTVPKGFEGRIFFVIKPNGNVEVHPVKNGDDKAAFKVVK